MISKLSLQEIKTDDCKVLRLLDNSTYNPNLPITNGILEVTPPGYDCPVFFNVDPYFNIALTSSNLKLSPEYELTQLVSLPDGVYTIKYSIKPNNSIYVEYELFRNCQINFQYINNVCQLFQARCELSLKEFERRLEKLNWIKQLIDASKYKVEECGDKKQGIELYNEARLMLDEYCKNSC